MYSCEQHVQLLELLRVHLRSGDAVRLAAQRCLAVLVVRISPGALGSTTAVFFWLASSDDNQVASQVLLRGQNPQAGAWPFANLGGIVAKEARAVHHFAAHYRVILA